MNNDWLQCPNITQKQQHLLWDAVRTFRFAESAKDDEGNADLSANGLITKAELSRYISKLPADGYVHY